MDKPLRISVIIPTLDEAAEIGDCLDQFDIRAGAAAGTDSDASTELEDPTGSLASVRASALEIIVVDGGSSDGTGAIVRARPSVRFIEHGERGRAVQMNAGAATATGDVLLFLHADTRLPERWREYVTDSILRGGMAGGRFRFDVAHPSRVYRWIARGTNFRSRFLGITYGDQAIYAARTKFEQVGGYPEIPVFEDAGLADRLKQAGGLDWVDEPVLTSARRWERRGALRTLLLTWTLRALYTLSVSPSFLTRFYGVVR